MPHPEDQLPFAALPETLDFDALLFDMDGTIIDSTDAIVKHWHQIGEEIGVPGEEILRTSHGRRSIDVLALHAPHLATWAYVCAAEAAIPHRWGADATEIPGARALLARLDAAAPAARWAIVTSGTRDLVAGWLARMALAQPKVMVTAEEVKHGKPSPECYVLGAERVLGTGPGAGAGGEVLVLEDAPAGVRAGKEAGFRVVAVATTHEVGKLREAGADWIVRDLRSVTVQRVDGKTGRVTVEIRDALVGV